MQRVMTREVSDVERMMLAVAGIMAGLLGILMFFAPGQVASLTGYSGSDNYIAQMGGAALLGYPVALAWVLGTRNWISMRIVVVGLLGLGLAMTVACALELAGGQATTFTYLVLAGALIAAAIAGYIIYSRGMAPEGSPDIARWVVYLVILGIVLATTFGVLPMIAPSLFGQLVGFPGHDIFIYQLAGAACFSFAPAGYLEFRSQRWLEIRGQALAAMIFNGLAAVASFISLATMGFTLLAALVGPVAGAYAIASGIALRRQGQ